MLRIENLYYTYPDEHEALRVIFLDWKARISRRKMYVIFYDNDMQFKSDSV